LLQLICLFTTEPDLDYTSSMIQKTYNIVYNRIFVLSIEDSEELICSFNIEKGNVRKQLPGAMLVHRKRDTNTMYTINSLNALVKSENNGILDSNYTVDWTKYRNSLLVTSNNELKILRTKVYQIINLQ
jgi:hypothetical protein